MASKILIMLIPDTDNGIRYLKRNEVLPSERIAEEDYGLPKSFESMLLQANMNKFLEVMQSPDHSYL